MLALPRGPAVRVRLPNQRGTQGKIEMKILWLLFVLAMQVPEPKWPDMILRCDGKNCYWTCEWGFVTTKEIIDGSEIQVSTSCVKKKPDQICPPCSQYPNFFNQPA